MIVAIEGIDGAGKNTLVQALREQVDAEYLAFPRYEDSVHAKLAQAALYGRMGDLSDSIYGMATLFALDRLGAREQLEQAAQSSEILLLDRYVASNAAYSVARAQDPSLAQWVADLEFGQFELPRPTLQVLLGTDVDLAAQRAAAREIHDASRVRDQYESDSGLQLRTAEAYANLAQQQWFSPWMVVDPAQQPSAVATAVLQALGQ
ncbi:dTMP kinase [Corynebacterium pelargi]|uniref:Thymidylate kinase n=1 Tax=Corynebacterium pelargi TaxID=1471400 RepID=A0A410WAG7_9CORY|nr:dTMP kinase [Corynebacterium pelargi]QAU52929.1 Thymidylate kinase [Corynebacterium pelargi]GGG75992.1 thymidylate kinase [Corynebacterium pelargi]